jgi:hypothetical protein
VESNFGLVKTKTPKIIDIIGLMCPTTSENGINPPFLYFIA